MAGRFISGLLPTQWLQPQYSRLPGSHNSNFSRPPYTGRSVFTILVLVLEAVLIALTCWWAFPRIHNTLDYWQNAPTSNGGKALVIASFKKQDVSWIDRIPSSWDIYRYFLDDPHPLNNLSVPRNNGRESMAYLTYIIDHYDNLPDYVIFTHGHERSWHQIEPLPLKIRALNLTALEHENYISLRCENQMGCERIPYLDNQDPNWAGENHLAEFWDSIMPDVEFPRYIAYKCCGQHAVTKKAIMAHTKEDWIRIRSPLLRDLEDIQENEIWGSKPTADEWILGMFYEKIWHVLFGMGGEYCPNVAYCRQVHFSNAIVCDSDMDTAGADNDFDLWKEIKCVSAFDDLEPDEPADLDYFRRHRVLDAYWQLHAQKNTKVVNERKRLQAAEAKLRDIGGQPWESEEDSLVG